MGSELECLRFLGRPGPRRAGLRELSSLLGGVTEGNVIDFQTLHPQAYWRVLPRRVRVGLRQGSTGSLLLRTCISRQHALLLYSGI